MVRTWGLAVPGVTDFQLVSLPFPECSPLPRASPRGLAGDRPPAHTRRISKPSAGAGTPTCCLLGRASRERPGHLAANKLRMPWFCGQPHAPVSGSHEPRPSPQPCHRAPCVTRGKGSHPVWVPTSSLVAGESSDGGTWKAWKILGTGCCRGSGQGPP